jgi:hypothetical protein|uniref:Uncharacterized protein n=1 Tax=viral metagenome TaxID=1070528 RepID=A0A6C0DI55_9ZZZZ
MFKEVTEFFFQPLVAFTILVLFLLIYICFIGYEGGFTEKFLHFGPGTTPENTTNFIGIKMDTWEKVGILYVVSFFSALINQYYVFAVSENLGSYVWQRAEKVVPHDKFWTYFILFAEPVIGQLLGVIAFFTTLTLQLQFILPEMVGGMIAHIPGVMRRLADKEFDPEYLLKNKKK